MIFWLRRREKSNEFHVATNFNAVKEGKKLIKEFSTVPNNREFIKLKIRVANGRDLTDINKTILAKFEARMILCKDYGPGSLATIGVLDAARRYAATNERFDQELNALSASSAVDIRDSWKFAKLGSRDRLN